MTLEQLLKAGISHHQAGRLAEAESIYRQILAEQPNHVVATYRLGVLMGQAGRLDLAEDFFRQAVRIKPDYANAHNNLGYALNGRGQLDEAITSFRHAVRLNPDLAEAHSNLGNALAAKGQFDEAITFHRHAVRLNPDLAEAHSNLGNALAGNGQLDEAITFHRHAIRLKPDLAEAHSNLGDVLKKRGQLDEAIASYRHAIRLKPDYAEAHSKLGSALKRGGQLDEAIAALRQAIRLKPGYTVGHSDLALALLYHPNYDAGMIHEELRRWNQQHAEPLRKFIQPHVNKRDPECRLRIGYVSANFRIHSVSRFLLSLFRQHDHGAYEIICYSDVLKSDVMTDRLRACTDGWENIVGWNDERVAGKVREDEIDVLVDLAGHTGGNRLRVFARKPAPVQVSYLGYPGSTGLSEMDYRLTDSLADPPGKTESFHSEKLLRLPVCNWCFSEPDDAPPVGPLPAEAAGSICFGTFNFFAKASPAIMDLWAAILIAMPLSRLIIKSRGLGEQGVRERIHKCFASRGVQANRLEIRGHEPKVISHFDAYNQMDIALDTFPYHGTTTTCEAIWMGVPVVSLAGQTHVSRVGVSLLKNVGLTELIAQTPKQYVEIAVGLANDLPRLAELRRMSRSRMRASPLMDGPRFARDIEAAYRQMWRNWCARPQ
jgi:predicted O-linked N-acetylglucosamine transferase (SPINDLY family)